MARPLFLVYQLVSLCLRLTNLCSGDDQQFVYSGFTGTNLSTDGVAAITSDGMLELTNGTLQRKGHAFYPEPVRLREPANGTARSFSTSFVFGILSDHVELSAHGMAFVVAGSRDFSGALPSGYLGLLNVQSNGNSSNRLFAVELDTMQNDEFQPSRTSTTTTSASTSTAFTRCSRTTPGTTAAAASAT
jgi:hypothetical protein